MTIRFYSHTNAGSPTPLTAVVFDELVDELDIDRPEWPYRNCRECEHPRDEHDENHRCHMPGCTCGMNKW